MNDQGNQPRGPGFPEFVILIALIISLVALSIDAMLPALPGIAADLGVVQINDSQYVISIFFAGMALGQIFFGPLSDSIGRRPAIIAAAQTSRDTIAMDLVELLISIFFAAPASSPRRRD